MKSCWYNFAANFIGLNKQRPSKMSVRLVLQSDAHELVAAAFRRRVSPSRTV
jgi:hypothetical protein